MKKSFLLLCFLCLFVCISCSSDDDGIKNIVGTWEAVSYSNYGIDLETGARTDYYAELESPFVVVFTHDGICSVNGHDGYYSINGNKLDIYIPDSDDSNLYNVIKYKYDEIVITHIYKGYEYDSNGTDSYATLKEIHQEYTLRKVGNDWEE